MSGVMDQGKFNCGLWVDSRASEGPEDEKLPKLGRKMIHHGVLLNNR